MNGMIDKDGLEILIKGWDRFQELAKSNGESAWKIRAWGIGVWSALIAFSYTSQKIQLAVVAQFVLAVVLLVEMTVRQIQYAYIAKSIEIEASINAILVGESPNLPENGISTNFNVPTVRDFLKLLRPKRWLIWFPYVLLAFGGFGRLWLD